MFYLLDLDHQDEHFSLQEAPYPSLLETVSAPSSNDSGHVSGGPCSLPSISSTKEMSIASSPPLDIDPIEFSEDNYKDITDIAVTNHNEFTKVTKKQRKKKKRGSERVLYPQTSHEDEARSSSQGPEAASDQAGWFRGYRAIRGSREAVSGTKSTCSGQCEAARDWVAMIMLMFQFPPARRVTRTTTTVCTVCRWAAPGPRSV